MNGPLDAVGLWLADLHLPGGVMLAVVSAALAVLRQPAKRMAVIKATLARLLALAALCALPG